MLRVNDPPCMGLRITLASLPSVTLARVPSRPLLGVNEDGSMGKEKALGDDQSATTKGFLLC